MAVDGCAIARYRWRMKKSKPDTDEINALRLIRGRALKQGDKLTANKTLREISVIIADEYKDDPVEYLFYQSLAAREELLFEKHGHHQTAGRTRKSISENTLLPCLELWAGAKEPTSGFVSLVGNDLSDLTAEAIVLMHPEGFSAETLATAQKRLDECVR